MDQCLTIEQIIERDKELQTHFSPEYLVQEINRALRDSAYAIKGPRSNFNWERFAHDLLPDLDSPLKAWELFYHLRKYFAPPGTHDVPRNRIWWIVRIVIGVEDPDRWLLEQRRQGGRWAKAVAARFTEYR